MSSIRRILTAVVLAGLVGGVLWWNWAGGAGGDPSAVRVRFWNGFTGPDGRTMLRLIQRFNQENADAHVLMQRMDWATYYNKLFVAGLGGRAPEVFVIHVANLPRFHRAGFIRPVDDLLAGRHPFDPNVLDASCWRAVEFGGRHLGVPLDVHPQGLYYNRRLFREAGLVDESGRARPPTTRGEFLDAARRLTRDLDGDGRPDQWGFAFTHVSNNFHTLMPQFGGDFFDAGAGRCTLDDPRNVEALRFGVELIHTHRVAPNPEDVEAWIGFRQGKVAMVFDGVYMLQALLRQKDLDFAGAPVPRIGRRPGTLADSHTLCLYRGLDGRRLEAAWQLVRFLSDHSLEWAGGGQVPVRPRLRGTPEFAAMPVQSQFARQVPYLNYPPRVPFLFEFRSEFGLAVERALRGRAPAAESLAAATKNVQRVIERDREIFGRPAEAGP